VQSLSFGLLLLAASSCRQPRAIITDAQFARLGARRVASIAPECSELTDFVFSPGGERVIYTGWISNARSRRVGVWVGDSLLLRADTVFELGFTERNEPYFLGTDSGKAFAYYRYSRPRAYERVAAPSFSRDGSQFAYLTQNGGRQTLVVGDGTTQTVAGVLDYALSPNGTRFAYAARNGDDWIVVEGPDTSDVYDWVEDVVYSRDGSSLAFAALADDEWFAVLNGEELDGFGEPAIELSEVTLSSNGGHVAYAVTEYDEKEDETYEYAVVDGRESDIYLDISDLCLAPNGERLAFVADDGDGQFVVTDGSEEAPYDQVWGLTYSPDGSNLAYCARTGDVEFVVVNGNDHAGYAQVDKVKFSRDGRRIGYGAIAGLDFLWIVEDGQ
jgi:WD40 repeat protein